MSLKLWLIIATVAVATLPEMAHACTGNACNFVTPTTKLEEGTGGVKIFTYTLFNKDKDRRIGAVACIIFSGSSCIPTAQMKGLAGSSDTFEYQHNVIIDPGQTANSATNGLGLFGVLPGDGDKPRQPHLDIQSAVFLDPPKGNGQQQGGGQQQAQAFGSGNVSFVNVDTVEIDLVVTDNVSGGIGTKTFHLGAGKDTGTFKVSGDSQNGGKSNFNWKASGQDASRKKVSRCKTEKQPIRGGSYGRIDVSAGVGRGQNIGASC